MGIIAKEDLTLKRMLLYILIGIFGLLILKVLVALLPLAILLFLFLAPPVFVLADAQERGVKRPVVWAIFTLFTSVFGLLVYLLARPEGKPHSYCTECGGVVEPSFHNCPWCGNAIQASITCKECSFELKSGWKFCPQCHSPTTSPKNESVQGEAIQS